MRKVCEVCLGNAETTRDECKCSGSFGSKECNDWLWGWFVVDDTVERAARARKINEVAICGNFARKDCPDDCIHKKGRFCLLSPNHCIRQAEDHYEKDI